jgi:hypothetical protein
MTSPAPANPDGNPAGRFFGVLMMVAGVLIAGLSGLCTTVFGVAMTSEAGHNPREVGGLVVVMAIFGGIPFGFGVLAFFIGRFLYRSGRRPKPPLSTFD